MTYIHKCFIKFQEKVYGEVLPVLLVAVGFRIKFTAPAGLNYNAGKVLLCPYCTLGQPILHLFTHHHQTSLHDTQHTEPVATHMLYD